MKHDEGDRQVLDDHKLLMELREQVRRLEAEISRLNEALDKRAEDMKMQYGDIHSFSQQTVSSPPLSNRAISFLSAVGGWLIVWLIIGSLHSAWTGRPLPLQEKVVFLAGIAVVVVVHLVKLSRDMRRQRREEIEAEGRRRSLYAVSPRTTAPE